MAFMKNINFKAAIILAGLAIPFLCAAAENHEGTVRAFVKKCLDDPKVFVLNPQADMNPYKKMSQQQIEELMHNAIRDGSTLMLYHDGMPARFWSYKDHKEHGLQKEWYPDGKVMSEEDFENGRIVTGRYWDIDGRLLGQIDKGTGKKVLIRESYDHAGFSIRTITEYRNGLKDGIESWYQDYVKGLKREESLYKEGKLHGKKTGWRTDGTKNYEYNYRNGQEHGDKIFWHANGRIQSVSTYVDGKQVGSWTTYYENGNKATEHVNEYTSTWYPSGQLMVQKKYSEGSVVDAESFDTFGNQTGKVIEGNGSLVEAREPERLDEYQLLTFKRGQQNICVSLPGREIFAWSYSDDDNILHCTVRFTAPRGADLEAIRARLLLPEGYISSRKLEFSSGVLKSGYSENAAAWFPIALPQPHGEWTGQMMADVEAVIGGQVVRYQFVAYEGERFLI